MSKIIGILGCGWLGKPLAVALLEQGLQVKGTTTHIAKLDQLRNAGIDPYLVDLKETYIDGDIEEFLTGLDVLILNIPPGLRSNPNSDFAGRIRLLVTNINRYKSIKQLIYISSTSVFKDTVEIPIYTETSKPNAEDQKGKKLIAAEEAIELAQAKTTIIRPGGLMGGDRHPVKYLAGKSGISNPEAPINLTDRDYLIDLIHGVISGKINAPVIHAINEPHEDRKSYYTRMAQVRELEPPTFSDEKSVGKKIVSSLL